jgi:hypothetical protein
VKTTEILTALDAEIARLQQARNASAGLSCVKRRGRPSASASPNKTNPKKRTLSAEAREKIAARTAEALGEAEEVTVTGAEGAGRSSQRKTGSLFGIQAKAFRQT